MTPVLAAIWRHPVKSLGSETLPRVRLAAGRALPGDRVWAIAHGASAWDAAAPAWAPCANFLRVAHVPELARVTATLDDATGRVSFRHPARPDLTVEPATAEGAGALTAWVAPLAGERRPGPYRLAHAPGAAMTDAPEPWVSVMSLASLRALGQSMGAELDPRRFRGNLWLDGLAPWEERGWDAGAEIAIGPVRLRIEEPVERCRATEAGPATGRHDAPTLAALRAATGGIEFGVYASTLAGGEIAAGDPVRIP